MDRFYDMKNARNVARLVQKHTKLWTVVNKRRRRRFVAAATINERRVSGRGARALQTLRAEAQRSGAAERRDAEKAQLVAERAELFAAQAAAATAAAARQVELPGLPERQQLRRSGVRGLGCSVVVRRWRNDGEYDRQVAREPRRQVG